MKSDTYQLMVVRCTQAAVCVREPGRRFEFWLPFSQILDPSEEDIRECVGTDCEIEIPDWLAEEKDLL